MLSYRVIPVLLLSRNGLVKTKRFENPNYIGDPINAIKIFNDKEVDELVFLDIDASKEKRGPDYKLLENIATECFMPLGYGGGISNVEQVNRIFNIGIEKVIFNSMALSNPQLISDVAKIAGNQSVVISIDVKKNWLGEKIIYSHCSLKVPSVSVSKFAKKMQELGAGEIIINSVDHDGMMSGYDIELISEISESVNLPVIACGGAGSKTDFLKAINAGASGMAAGSMFIYHGPHNAVLINYPTQEELKLVLA